MGKEQCGSKTVQWGQKAHCVKDEAVWNRSKEAYYDIHQGRSKRET